MAQEFFLSKLLKPLCERLLDMRRDNRAKLSELGKNFGDPFALASLYVEPNCQHGNPADFDEVSSPVYRPLFDTLNDFIRTDSAKKDGRNHLFLLGDAGMGKTSALLMLYLSHICSFWPKPYKCTLHKLCGTTISDIKGIEDPANTILLLDAIDEHRPAWEHTESYIGKLIKETIYFKKVIVSCRTQFFPQGQRDLLNRAGMLVIRGAYTCPVMYLSLFNDSQVEEYLSKKFTEITHSGKLRVNKNKVKVATDILGRLHNLKFRPLLLSYIDDIIESDLNSERPFEIYNALVTVWLQRECQKMEELDLPTLEAACIYAAYEMQKGRDGRTLSEQEIEKLKKNYPNIRLMHKLEIGGRSLLNRNSDGDFRFSHYTIQEFMIAKGLKEQNYDNRIGTVPLTDMILVFLQSIDYSPLQTEYINASIPGIRFESILKTKLTVESSKVMYAIVNGCIINNFSVKNSDLYSIKISDLTVPASTIIANSNLSYGQLLDSKMLDSKFFDVNMRMVSITRSDLKGSLFIGTDFSSCAITESSLSECVFHNCNFQSASFKGTNIQGAKFSSCLNLSASEVTQAANWEKASFDPTFAVELQKASGKEALRGKY